MAPTEKKVHLTDKTLNRQFSRGPEALFLGGLVELLPRAIKPGPQMILEIGSLPRSSRRRQGAR